MGTSGAEIFDDDVAWDTRAAFLRALTSEQDLTAATAQVLLKYRRKLKNVDDGPTLWFALAVVQLEQGALQNVVRDQVVRIIDSDGGLSHWEDGDPDSLAERKSVLADLRERVLSATDTG